MIIFIMTTINNIYIKNEDILLNNTCTLSIITI